MNTVACVFVMFLIVVGSARSFEQEPPPLRLALAGLVHGHVSGFLRAAQGRKDVVIVGVFEPDTALLRTYATRVLAA